MEEREVMVSDRLAAWAWTELGDTAPGATSWGNAIRVNCPIDPDTLEKGIQNFIREFDAYRMVFTKKDDKIYAKVLEDYDFKLTVIDVPGNTKEEQMKYVMEDCQRRIDSRYKIDECCSQFALYHLDDYDNVIFIGMVHLITDGFSLSLTFFNVISYYLQNQPIFGMEDKGSFLEYIEDEMAYLNSKAWEKDIPYWDEVMRGFDKDLVKPLGLQVYDKEKSGVYFNLSSKNIPQIAEKYGSSVFHILLTAFHLTKYSVNGTADSLATYADANRSKKYNNTLGFLAIFVPSRVQMNRNMYLSELIRGITKQSQKDYAHRKAGSCFYGKSDYILSYLPNREGTYDDSFLESAASTTQLEVIDFKNGRDNGRRFTFVVNDMNDIYKIEIFGSSRVYGQDYIERFKNEFSRIFQLISTGEDMLVSEILGLEDEIEEI